MKFPESKLAHSLLDGLKGIEVGGSAHNPFGLDTINVDRYAETDTIFKRAEMELCGEILPVDIVAPGDQIPVPDKSVDFIISSHVIEHFYDPIKALREWQRIARKYIFIICPHRDRTKDRDRTLTTITELKVRNQMPDDYEFRSIDKHWNVWNTQSFIDFVSAIGFHVHTFQDIDDKVGNGFTVVIDLER